MIQVLEAVPNFSEGRDLAKIEALVARIAEHDVEVLDWSADADHHRSVVTFIGAPSDVEAASLAAASFAVEHFDLRCHSGVHPRVGAVDVLPFVPLHGLDMADAVASARRVGRGLAAMGVPVFFYGHASTPPGRGLADVRRGGFEALTPTWADGRRPDLPSGPVSPHPSAGVTCVGARRVLLAWNVFVSGLDIADVRRIASLIRERDGGFPGLRALGLALPRQHGLQVSMNLEDPDVTSPIDVFERIASLVAHARGNVVETQVIGMIPDTLVHPDVAGRLKLPDPGSARVLSHRVAAYLAARDGGRTEISDPTV